MINRSKACVVGSVQCLTCAPRPLKYGWGRGMECYSLNPDGTFNSAEHMLLHSMERYMNDSVNCEHVYAHYEVSMDLASCFKLWLIPVMTLLLQSWPWLWLFFSVSGSRLLLVSGHGHTLSLFSPVLAFILIFSSPARDFCSSERFLILDNYSSLSLALTFTLL
jgi:hypothetical protein